MWGNRLNTKCWPEKMCTSAGWPRMGARRFLGGRGRERAPGGLGSGRRYGNPSLEVRGGHGGASWYVTHEVFTLFSINDRNLVSVLFLLHPASRNTKQLVRQLSVEKFLKQDVRSGGVTI